MEPCRQSPQKALPLPTAHTTHTRTPHSICLVFGPRVCVCVCACACGDNLKLIELQQPDTKARFARAWPAPGPRPAHARPEGQTQQPDTAARHSSQGREMVVMMVRMFCHAADASGKGFEKVVEQGARVIAMICRSGDLFSGFLNLRKKIVILVTRGMLARKMSRMFGNMANAWEADLGMFWSSGDASEDDGGDVWEQEECLEG